MVAQLLPFGENPIAVTIGEKIALILCCRLRQHTHAFVGYFALFGASKQVFEVLHIDNDAGIGPPHDKPLFDGDGIIQIGPRLLELVEQVAHVGASLSLVGIGPEQVSDLAAGEWLARIEGQECHQFLQARLSQIHHLRMVKELKCAQQLKARGWRLRH